MLLNVKTEKPRCLAQRDCGSEELLRGKEDPSMQLRSLYIWCSKTWPGYSCLWMSTQKSAQGYCILLLSNGHLHLTDSKCMFFQIIHTVHSGGHRSFWWPSKPPSRLVWVQLELGIHDTITSLSILKFYHCRDYMSTTLRQLHPFQ